MTTKTANTEKSWIQKRPNVCGGDACIRDTRIPVWSIIHSMKLGVSTADLKTHFVTPLTSADVDAAIAYYHDHTGEIDDEIRLNEEA